MYTTSQLIFQNDSSDLLDLIWFCHIAHWLDINNLFDTVFSVNEMIAFYSALKAEPFQNCSQIRKQQIFISCSAKNR